MNPIEMGEKMNIDIGQIVKLTNNSRNRKWALNHWEEYEKFIPYSIDINLGLYHINSMYEDVFGKFEINIELDQNFDVLDQHCTCRFNEEDSACGHVLAVLYIFKNETFSGFPAMLETKVEEVLDAPDYVPMTFDEWMRTETGDSLLGNENINDSDMQKMQVAHNNMSEYFYEKELRRQQDRKQKLFSYLRKSEQQAAKELLEFGTFHLEFTFTESPYRYNEALTLIATIGAEKQYKIKRFDKFFNRIRNGEFHSYGAKLKFTHTLASFDQETQNIFPYLENLSNNYYHPVHGEIEIMEANLDYFYDHFKEYPSQYINIQFTETSAPQFTIYITEHDDTYALSIWSEHVLRYGLKNIYTFENNKLCRIKSKKIDPFIELKNTLTYNDMLFTATEVTEILTVLQKICGLNFVIDGDPLNEQQETTEEAIIKIYADIEDDNLKLDTKIQKMDEKEKQLTDFNTKEVPYFIRQMLQVLTEISEPTNDKNTQLVFPLSKPQTLGIIEHTLPSLNGYCEVFLSESLQNLDVNRSISMSVGVRVENDLLKMDISSIDCTPEEIAEILRTYKKKKRFFRLKNNKIITLDNQIFAEIDDMLEDMQIDFKKLDNTSLELPLFQAFKAKQRVEKLQDIDKTMDDSFQFLLKDFEEKKIEEIKVPKRFDKILKPYQKYGVQWLTLLDQYNFGGILADDMGLGKTLQVIAFLESTRKKGQTNIVVCPASLMLNWQEELEKFESPLKSICIYGTPEERAAQIKDCQKYDVVITTYDYVKRDIEHYNKIKFEHIIIDEAQYIKNHITQAAKTIKKLKGKTRFALTGTPIENSLAELWSIFDFLMPGYLLSYATFRKKYEKPIVKEGDKKMEKQLKQMVEAFLLRRRKEDVLTELPDKIEKNLVLPFSTEEEKLYVAHLSMVNAELQQAMQTETDNKMLILKLLTQLRQICCDPRLLFENVEATSSKMLGALELIESCKENGQKVLLFSSFTTVLDMIAEELQERNISHIQLTGKNKKEERKELVDQFQTGEVDVFLISLKAGGVGLNLTKAEAVIHFDPWWNLSAQNQATDRAYRIGQENNVMVYNLVMKNSIEEKILDLQQKKKELVDTFVENSEGSIASMTTTDIIALLER